MTRRGSRAEGRTLDTTTQRTTSYVTGDPIPSNTPVLKCACGGMYRSHTDSETAHQAVFGHRPIRKTAPATAESAPEA